MATFIYAFCAKHVCFHLGHCTNGGAHAVLLFRAALAQAVLLFTAAATSRPKHLKERSEQTRCDPLLTGHLWSA